MMQREHVRQGASWTGILAGVLAGLVVYLVLSVLGAALGLATVGLGGTDEIGGLTGLAIGAVICLLIAVIAAAFLGGATAARAAGFITPAQGRLNGLLTGMLLLVLLTVWSFNTLSRGISQALGFATSTASTLASATGNAAQSAAQGASNAGGAAQVSRSLGLGEEYRALARGFNTQELNQIIADGAPELNERQVAIAAATVRSTLGRSQSNITASLSNPSQLDNVIQQESQRVQQQLSEPEFTQRLEARGLSAAQAQEVSNAVSQRVQELQTQAQEAQRTAAQTARTAARATSTAAWLWLLFAGLMLGFAVWGGHVGGDRWARDTEDVAPVAVAPVAVAPATSVQGTTPGETVREDGEVTDDGAINIERRS